MTSKAFVFLGLLLAAFLLVSSAVSAETSQDEKNEKETNSADDMKKLKCDYGCCELRDKIGCLECCKGPYGGGLKCQYGCCDYHGKHGCLRCCKNPYETGLNCQYGCCDYHGKYGCLKCCSQPNEQGAEKETNSVDDAKDLKCKYGCCEKPTGKPPTVHGCSRCCKKPTEQVEAQTQGGGHGGGA